MRQRLHLQPLLDAQRLLNINNQKMSKSANNFFTVREIADKYGYEPIRYFMLTAGYRMPLNYTVDLIESCKNSLERLYTCRDNLDFAIRNAHGTDTALTEKCEEARKKFKTAMDDDLNTPDALAAILSSSRTSTPCPMLPIRPRWKRPPPRLTS